MKQLAIVITLLCVRASAAENVVTKEVKRYGRDAKNIATAPLHWTGKQWIHFAEGTAAVAALYAADRQLYDGVQRNRSAFTNDFAKAITPFGGRRAEYVSAALIAGGAWTGDRRTLDAGRDSLESEILAGGVITPLLKRAFGRARPVQGEGAHSFRPFSAHHESFPSGHATNAFAFATAIAAHYDGWIVPTIVYSIASGVAISRVNDRAHFPSDVLAGALIGRGIARSVVRLNQRPRTAWLVAPAVVNGHPAVFVRIVSR